MRMVSEYGGRLDAGRRACTGIVGRCILGLGVGLFVCAIDLRLELLVYAVRNFSVGDVAVANLGLFLLLFIVLVAVGSTVDLLRNLWDWDLLVHLGNLEILEEREDTTLLTEIVVNDVNEVPVLHQVVDHVTGRRSGIVATGPVKSKTVELISPGEEGYSLYNGGLHDLLAREDTPGDSIGAFIRRVGLQVTVLVHSEVGDVGVALHASDELRDQFRRNQNFEVSLLVDVTIARTPSIDGMARLGTINRRLRVDGQKTTLVEVDQILAKSVGFVSDGTLTPRQRLDFALHVVREKSGHITEGLGLSPKLAILLIGTLQANTIRVELSVSRRSTVTPSTVRELVPVLSASNV
ncbi:methylenetetrahydrofolate reductase 2, partial [Aureobasidium melanogenum]